MIISDAMVTKEESERNKESFGLGEESYISELEEMCEMRSQENVYSLCADFEMGTAASSKHQDTDSHYLSDDSEEENAISKKEVDSSVRTRFLACAIEWGDSCILEITTHK